MEASTPMRPTLFFLTSILFLASAAVSRAHIAEFDEYWQKKSEEAKARAQAVYNPNPEEETGRFNMAVHRALNGKNTTRRGLRTNKLGVCIATNPIDRCWRCKGDWNKERKRLAKCAKGFGRLTTGGADGDFYVVTDPSDSELINPKIGTLRHAVIQDRPLWIIFARSMVIRLQQELIMNSNKTIDGRGVDVQITGGAGLTIQYVHNIIVHGIRIHDIKSGMGGMIRDSEHHYGLRTKSDGDGISIFGASNVWIDHVSMSNCNDGLIDAIIGSTAITISNCHFTNHNDVMLFGSSDSYSGDAIMQITVAFNHFGKGLVQRMPRCRWGFFHVVNNDYTHWLMYALGGSKHPIIISQGNRYSAPDNIRAKEATKREYTMEKDWKDWSWRSDGDLMLNGAFFVQSGNAYLSSYSKKDFIKSKPGTFVTRLTRFSGALNCRKGFQC